MVDKENRLHELMHTAYLAMDFFNRHLGDEISEEDGKELTETSDRISELMYKLYNDIAQQYHEY